MASLSQPFEGEEGTYARSASAACRVAPTVAK